MIVDTDIFAILLIMLILFCSVLIGMVELKLNKIIKILRKEIQ